MNNRELAEKIINYLNELVELDPQLMYDLVHTRMPCRLKATEHPDAVFVPIGNPDIVKLTGKKYSLGLLGLLNGLCGVKEDGTSYIRFVSEGRKALRFEFNED